MTNAARAATATGSLDAHRPKLPALTSLRFFAAAAIVLHHIQGTYGIPHISFHLGQGVSLFFVLSGFVLAYNYPRLEVGTARLAFLVARVARIWPAHIAGILLVLALDRHNAIGAAPRLSINLLANLTMVQAWIPLNWFNYSFNGPSWSISTEFAFYVLFPLLILNFERTWWWKLAGSAALVATLVAICNALDLPMPKTYADGLNYYGLMYLNPAARLLEFVAGMCAALAWVKLSARNFVPRVSMSGTILEIAAVAFVAAGPTIGNAIYGAIPLLRSPPATLWFVNSGAIVIQATVLIAIMAAHRGWISRVLSFAPLLFLGEISYAIYLTHYTLLRWIVVHRPMLADLSEPLVLAGYLLAVFGISALVFLCIERPARRAIRSLGRVK